MISPFHRFMYALGVLTLLLAIGLMVSGMYLYFWQSNPPLEIRNNPMPVRVTDNTVVMTVDGCKFTDRPASIDISFVDSFIYNIPTMTMSGLSNGECKKAELSIPIPENLPSGEYYLRGKSTYDVNVLATRTVEWESQAFMIEKN